LGGAAGTRRKSSLKKKVSWVGIRKETESCSFGGGVGGRKLLEEESKKGELGGRRGLGPYSQKAKRNTSNCTRKE